MNHRDSRARECTQPAPRNRVLGGKQARRGKVAPWDVRQGSRNSCRPYAGAMRRGGLTFKLCQQEGEEALLCCSSIVRKTPKFLHGLPPGPARSVQGSIRAALLALRALERLLPVRLKAL